MELVNPFGIFCPDIVRGLGRGNLPANIALSVNQQVPAFLIKVAHFFTTDDGILSAVIQRDLIAWKNAGIKLGLDFAKRGNKRGIPARPADPPARSYNMF